MKIKISQENIINEIKSPTKGTELSAGIDIYAPNDIIVPVGWTVKVPLGIAVELNKDEVGIMSERSSMGIKGITSIGNIIDADYRGFISIILQNNNSESWSAKKNDKIGQIIICKLGDNSIEFVNELSETKRGEGGFGSTNL